ncbi:MAG TPA: hypothetical protein VLS53_03535, partial [Candidatus Dormibacteraeota bacterium]|nr:hypothetical protein [Candidatus Dormibacteraeota bacterium]
PPVKVNLDAKVVGIVLAVLAGLGALLGLLGLLGLFAVGAAYGRILLLAFIGIIIGIVADLMSASGGWRMYRGHPQGKRLAIYGIALAFVAELIIIIGYGLGASSVIQLICLVLFYYAVVVSRFSPETHAQTP